MYLSTHRRFSYVSDSDHSTEPASNSTVPASSSSFDFLSCLSQTIQFLCVLVLFYIKWEPLTPVWSSEKKPSEMTWKRQNQLKCFNLQKSMQPGNNSDTESTNNAAQIPWTPQHVRPENISCTDVKLERLFITFSWHCTWVITLIYGRKRSYITAAFLDIFKMGSWLNKETSLKVSRCTFLFS